MAAGGFTESYTDHIRDNLLSVTRRCPLSLQEYTTVAHLAFNGDDVSKSVEDLAIPVAGNVTEIVLHVMPAGQGSNRGPMCSHTFTMHCP